MNRHPIFAATLLIAAPFAAVAAPATAAVAAPVQLEAIVVTPKAVYSAREWQARQQQVAAATPVVLEKVIVTPARQYTVAEWRARDGERRYAATELRKARHWLRAVWHTLGLRAKPVEA